MSSKLYYLSLFAVFLLTTAAIGLPVVEEIPENPFDTGPIGNCQIPTSQQLPICSQYINYPVPEALLFETVAGIREKAVNGTRKSAESRELLAGNPVMAEGCGLAVEELQCYQKFPACSNSSTTVVFKNVNCEAKLQASCSVDSLKYICSGSVQQSLQLEKCIKVSTTPYNYKYCSSLQGWSDVYLTEWMNVSVVNSESDIEAFTMFGTSAGCTALYTELRCGEAGRCWHQGQRMEINSTRELCESVLSCVSSTLKKKLEEQLDCQSYPSTTYKLSTPATEITQPTVAATDIPSPQTVPTMAEFQQQPNSTTDNSKPPYVTFPYPDEDTNSATSLQYNNLLLLLTIIIISQVIL